MFRKFSVLAVLPLLAACGGSDFSLTIDRSSERVAQDIAKFEPNSLTLTSGLEPVKTEKLGGGSVRYVMPAESGKSGEVLIEVIEEGAQKTRLEVTVDVPRVTRSAIGGYEYLAEDAVEKFLKESMRAWEKDLEAADSTEASRNEVSDVISLLAIGMQDFDQFESVAETALLDKYLAQSTEAEWNATTSDWGTGKNGSSGSGSFASDNVGRDEFAYQDDSDVAYDPVDGGGWGSE